MLTADIARLFAASVGAGAGLDGYAARLASPALATHLRGYLTGSLDLVLRTPTASGVPRYLVVDYKTNWLAPGDEPLCAWHYRPDALAAEMQRDHYPLQAILYLVALHRYLRWRMPDYDPEANLAGRPVPVPPGHERAWGAARRRSSVRRVLLADAPRRWSPPCRICSTEGRARPDAAPRSLVAGEP